MFQSNSFPSFCSTSRLCEEQDQSGEEKYESQCENIEALGPTILQLSFTTNQTPKALSFETKTSRFAWENFETED